MTKPKIRILQGGTWQCAVWVPCGEGWSRALPCAFEAATPAAAYAGWLSRR